MIPEFRHNYGIEAVSQSCEWPLGYVVLDSASMVRRGAPRAPQGKRKPFVHDIATLPTPRSSHSRRLVCALGVAALATVGSAAQAQTRSAPPKPDRHGPVIVNDHLADLVARLLPAVVNIATTQGTGPKSRADKKPGSTFNEYFRDYFNQRRSHRRGSALGSGFIIDPKGYIVTNNHVITQATGVKVILQDGTKLDAKILGKDPRADLALLKVNPKRPLPFVRWGKSENMRVGDTVVAVGNPFGLGGTVTRGIISARHRHLRNFGGYPGASFVSFLQTDAAINKGNSGGPLFNLKGEVIGINTAIYSRGGTNVGIAFAVPSSMAKPIIDQLRKYGRTRRGWLGVRIQNVDKDLAKSLGLDRPRGALIANVISDGPAAKGGLLAGDIILKFDGQDVTDSNQLPQIVAATEPGKSVTVVVLRRKLERSFTVKLGELEKAEKKGALKQAPTSQSNQLATLGFTVAKITPQLVQRFSLRLHDGVVITAVDPQSYAWSKEIRPGDIILEMDMVKVATPADIKKRVAKAREARKNSTLLLVQKGENRRFIVVRFKKEPPR
jgi:serine protease Do